jgi:malate dehydrogenase (quinone)
LNKKISSRKNLSKVFHLSFVWGEKNVEYLKKRFEALQKKLFQYGLIRKELDAASNGGRDESEKVATSGGWY